MTRKACALLRAPSFKGEADPPDQLTLSNVSLRRSRSSTPASDGNSMVDLTFNRVAAELYDWHGGDVTSRKNDRPISVLDRTLTVFEQTNRYSNFHRAIRRTIYRKREKKKTIFDIFFNGKLIKKMSPPPRAVVLIHCPKHSPKSRVADQILSVKIKIKIKLEL